MLKFKGKIIKKSRVAKVGNIMGCSITDMYFENLNKLKLFS